MINNKKDILFDILKNNFFTTYNTKNILYVNINKNSILIDDIDNYTFNMFINDFNEDNIYINFENILSLDYNLILKEWNNIIKDFKNIILNL